MSINSTNFPRFESSVAMQEAIQKANDAFIDLFLTAARTKDPCAPRLLGVTPEALAEFSAVSKSDLIAAGRLGAPLFVPRVSDPSMLRVMFSKGFSRAAILAEFSKTMPLEAVNRSISSARD